MTKLWNYLKKTSKTVHELAKEFPKKTYRQLEKYRDADRLLAQEHKLRQEAEGELTIIKGIGNTSPELRDAKAKITELQSNLDKIKKENNDLYNRIADLTDADSNLEKARESGL